MGFDYRIFNRPVGIYWAGWNTDTHELGRNGWEISVDQNIRRNTMQIAINHPEMCLQGITEVERFEYEQILRSPHMTTLPCSMGMNQLAREIQFRHNVHHVLEFNPVEYRPTFVDELKISRLSDLAHFQTAQKPQHEVFLREPSMREILEMALAKQEPEQDRIRKEMMLRQELKGMRVNSKLHTELRLVA